MRRVVPAIALAAGALAAPGALGASVYQFDVTGVRSFGTLGNPGNDNFLVDAASALGFAPGTPLTLMGIGWNVAFTANPASQRSHFAAQVRPSDFAFNLNLPFNGGSGSGDGTSSSGGILPLPAKPGGYALHDGTIWFRFYELLDNMPGSPDGIYTGGFITLSFLETPPIPGIPLPSAGAMGLVGLAVLGARRRRMN